MLRSRALSLALLLGACALVNAAAPAPRPEEPSGHRVFELRTYYTNPGKMDDLHKRFREHTCRLFQKHGMTLVGFWTPIDEKDGKGDKLVPKQA
ncbi:MAG: NIPSNAP family protein [Isosphaeraceae bacterium]|nr:NIPSNAP family protein [Isosphaeraceae bacterium]